MQQCQHKRLRTLRGAAALPLRAVCLLGLVLTSAGTGAQGILFPGGPIPGRPPHIAPAPIVQPFYVKNLRVSTVINDAVAETTVEQTFVNSSSVQQEGTYL